MGFDISAPSVLLGSPADNPLIASVARRDFLPYQPSAVFPGTGRGMLAWLCDGITIGQDSVAVIGTDEAGISEAVGTLYDAVHGLDPLLPNTPPAHQDTVCATTARQLPQAAGAWEARLPYRADTLQALSGGRVAAMCADGTLAVLDSASGKELWRHALPPAESYHMAAAPDGKWLAAGANGTLRIYDAAGKLVAESKVDAELRITSLACSPDSTAVLVGGEGGLVACCNADGTRRWTHGGEAMHEYLRAMAVYRDEVARWRQAEIAWSDGMKNIEKKSFPAARNTRSCPRPRRPPYSRCASMPVARRCSRSRHPAVCCWSWRPAPSRRRLTAMATAASHASPTTSW